MKKEATKRIRKILFILAAILFMVLLLDNAARMYFPVKYKDYVLKYAEKYDLDPFLVFAVIKVESGFRPDAVSPRKAMGLMQITEKTGKWAAEKIDLADYSSEKLFIPEVNIMLGCWYLNSLLRQFWQNEETALAAYNAGSGNVSQWLLDKNLSSDGKNLDRIPFSETEKYLKRIKIYYSVYKKLYGSSF